MNSGPVKKLKMAEIEASLILWTNRFVGTTAANALSFLKAK